MNREYVIFWTNWDLYRQSFADVISLKNVQYIDTPLQNIKGLRRRIYNITHCVYRNPFKRMIIKLFQFIIKEEYWFQFYFNTKNIIEGNFLFLISPGWLINNRQYFHYLKKRFPQANFVIFLCDLFEIKKTRIPERLFELEDAKEKFNLILSFDQEDCKKYGFTYHPLVFSPYDGNIQDMPYSDIFFLGQPKNRFNELIACFEKFWEFGLITDIILINVNPKERVHEDKIRYVDGFISYEENLQHTLHSKCELEIMQQGGTGYTQRMCEVIALDKKIITNNPLIHEAPFYNPSYIFQIKSSEDITEEMCRKIRADIPVDYHYKEQISPKELLDFIDKQLS